MLMSKDLETFVGRFPSLRRLDLRMHDAFEWSFLGSDCALKLRSIGLRTQNTSRMNVEELARYCADTSRLARRGKKAIRLGFRLPSDFAGTLIEVRMLLKRGLRTMTT